MSRAGESEHRNYATYKDVRAKSPDSHELQAVLSSQALLVKIKRGLENQMCGLLKNAGLLIVKTMGAAFAVRVRELVVDSLALAAAVGLLAADIAKPRGIEFCNRIRSGVKRTQRAGAADIRR